MPKDMNKDFKYIMQNEESLASLVSLEIIELDLILEIYFVTKKSDIRSSQVLGKWV